MEGRVLLHDIVSAMEAGELQAYYQPQYNAKKGVIGGAEALVRWVKPDGTIVYPADFIPVLEENGQLSIVDWFVAEEACKTIKELGDKAVRISVNFGREHAKDIDFVPKLNALIEEYGIDKNYFGVEITESDFATDKDVVINWVSDVEKAGYMVSIDDFGSGMSSLSFVKDIPARVLKIDRSFLNDNCQSKKGRIALESVFYFAHRLKLATVVEGVETQEQLQFINTCDCDYIQGFLFSKPMPKDDFLVMCTEEAPVEIPSSDGIQDQAMFSIVNLLINSVYQKFPLIIIANISKNSYQIYRRESFLDATVPETGTYDNGCSIIKKLCNPKDYKALGDAFSRENLLKAYERGERKVLRIVNQQDENGDVHRVSIEDYFIQNPTSNDVYIVCFMQRLDFSDDVIL